jgi:hypothetical protein
MSLKCYVSLILLWMHFSLHLILEASLENSFVGLTPSMMHVTVFCDIRSDMVSKHSELMKRHTRDRYGRFASPSSCIAPPPSRMQEVRSSNRRCIAPPPSRMQEVGSSSRRRTAPPPRARRRLQRMTRWRYGWWLLLLLRHAWVTPPRHPRATTMSALKTETWAHMNIASRFHLFSIITKCIRSFLDSKVRK